MKEGTETQKYYLEFGPLSKWRSHAKIWVQISKIERDFKIFGPGGKCPPWDFQMDPSGPGFEVAGSNDPLKVFYFCPIRG